MKKIENKIKSNSCPQKHKNRNLFRNQDSLGYMEHFSDNVHVLFRRIQEHLPATAEPKYSLFFVCYWQTTNKKEIETYPYLDPNFQLNLAQ